MGETERDGIEVRMSDVRISIDVELFEVDHLVHRLTEDTIDFGVPSFSGCDGSQHKFDDILCEAIVLQDCVEEACLDVPWIRSGICGKGDSVVQPLFARVTEEPRCP